MNAELANHLYRIAQEAVRNAVRHGQARSIRLHLSSSRAKVRLSITDDGVGMPIDATDAAGMGLKTMRYRARILGGDVRFEPRRAQWHARVVRVSVRSGQRRLHDRQAQVSVART